MNQFLTTRFNSVCHSYSTIILHESLTDTILAVCLVISVNWQNWGQDMRHRSVSQTCVSHPCEKNRTGLVLCLRPIIKPELPFVILAKPVGTKCRLKLVMHKHQWRRQSLSTNEPKDISLWGHGEGKWAEKKRKTLIFNDCLHHTQIPIRLSSDPVQSVTSLFQMAPWAALIQPPK